MKRNSMLMVCVLAMLAAGSAQAAFVQVYSFLYDDTAFYIGNYTDSRTDELADFNGDGAPELLLQNGAVLSITTLSGSGFTPTELWTFTLDEPWEYADMLAANLDPAPGKEVVIAWSDYETSARGIIVVDATGTELWRFTGAYFGDLADFNNDGLEEIITGDPATGEYIVWAYAEMGTSVPAEGAARGSLFQNAPNPFNPQTSLDFDLAQAGKTTVSVYDARGRLVWRRDLGEIAAGRHSVTWNGVDRGGRKAAAGVYHYVVQSADWTSSRSMVMVK